MFKVFCFFDHFIDVFWTFFSVVNICYFELFISYIVSTFVSYCTVFSCCSFRVKCVSISINLCCFIRICSFTWSYISIYSFIYCICSIFSKSSVDVVFLEWSYFFLNFYSFFVNISDFLFYTRSIVSWSFITIRWINWSTNWIFYSYKFKIIFFYFSCSVRLFFVTFCSFSMFSFSFYNFSILVFCDVFVVFLEWTTLLNSCVDVSYFLFSIFYKFTCSFATISIWSCTICWFYFCKCISWLIYFRCFVFFSNITSYNWSVICKVCRNYISFFIYCFINVVFLEGTFFWCSIFSVNISYFKIFSIDKVSCNFITCNISCYFSWFCYSIFY